MTGFILTFQDVTDDINQYDITHEKLVSLKKDLSRHLKLVERSLIDPSKQDQLIKTLNHLPRRFDQVTDNVLDVLLSKLPLTKLLILEFLNSLQRRVNSLHGIKLNITHQTENDRMLADTYSFMAAWVFLFKNLSDICLVNEFNINFQKNDDTIIFKITWPNNSVEKDRIETLLSRRINALPSLFYVLKQNNTLFQIIADNKNQCSQINIITQAELKIKTPLKGKQRSPIITGSRPEFYDFNLFRAEEENIDLLDTN